MSVTHFRSCHLCEAMCGIKIEVADDKILSIKGDPDDKLSRGFICPKATAIQDIHEDPDRLRKPMQRQGSEWVEIEWQQAYAIVAKELIAVQQQYGNDAVGVYMGNPAVHNYGMLTNANDFFRFIKTKNRYSATSVDQLPHHLVGLLMYGHQGIIPVPDIDNTDYILMLGANPMASNGSIWSVPDFRGRLKELKKRGGELVLIDPRRSETAAVATQYQAIKPGTDVVFLLALLNTLFAEDLIKTSHLPLPDQEIKELQVLTAEYSAEMAANICGIAAEAITRIAREYAKAPKAACYGRMGVSVQSYGYFCQWLIQVLNLLTDNLDTVGGMMFNRPAFDGVGNRSGRPGHFAAWHSRVNGLPEFSGELPSAALAEEIATSGEGQIKALITGAGNPVLSTPNGAFLDEACEQLQFMVSIDFYINETTRHANIILPPTAALEHDHYDLGLLNFATRRFSKFNPEVFDRPEYARHDWEIFQGLGRAMAEQLGQEPPMYRTEPWQYVDKILKMGPYGQNHPLNLSVETLKQHPHGIDIGALEANILSDRLWTESGLINLIPDASRDEFARVKSEWASPSEDDGSLLLIGRRHVRSCNSWMHNYPRLVKGKPRDQLLMHPDDMQNRQIRDGDTVCIESAVGKVTIAVQASTDMMPGVVSLPHGYGHNRSGTRLTVASQHAGASINDITDHRRIDAVSGNAAVNATPVFVTTARQVESA